MVHLSLENYYIQKMLYNMLFSYFWVSYNIAITGGYWLHVHQFPTVGPTVAFQAVFRLQNLPTEGHPWANSGFLFKMSVSSNKGFWETLSKFNHHYIFSVISVSSQFLTHFLTILENIFIINK